MLPRGTRLSPAEPLLVRIVLRASFFSLGRSPSTYLEGIPADVRIEHIHAFGCLELAYDEVGRGGHQGFDRAFEEVIRQDQAEE